MSRQHIVRQPLDKQLICSLQSWHAAIAGAVDGKHNRFGHVCSGHLSRNTCDVIMLAVSHAMILFMSKESDESCT